MTPSQRGHRYWCPQRAEALVNGFCSYCGRRDVTVTTSLKFKVLDGGRAPVRATEGAAGLDLCARVDDDTRTSIHGSGILGQPHVNAAVVPRAFLFWDADIQSEFLRAHVVKIPLGVAFAIPPGHVGKLYLRSSLGKKGLLMPNGAGIIDSDYRGEVSALICNLSGEDFAVKDGDRICQLVVVPCPLLDLEEVDELDETARGAGGFGSTGAGDVKASGPGRPWGTPRPRGTGGFGSTGTRDDDQRSFW